MTLWHLYVGCFTADLWNHYPRAEGDTTLSSDGIERYLFDDSSGEIRHVDSYGFGLSSPQYLQFNPMTSVVYAAEFTEPGRLSALKVNSEGGLSRLSTTDTQGSMAVAVDIHPKGRWAYVVHLRDGTLSTCGLDEAGRVTSVDHFSSSSRLGDDVRSGADRLGYWDGGSKLHQVRVLPNGAGVVVADVGRDEVVTYRFGHDGRIDELPISRVQFPPGSAPRHFEFSPSGNYLYVLGEYDANLYVLEADDFVPVRVIGAHSAVPPSHRGTALSSELDLHPDGSTLFVGVRHANCITAFAIDDAGGAEVLIHEPSLGVNPRGVRVDPAGKHLLVGNWLSNNLAVFSIDAARRLHPVSEPLHAPSPSSILFVEALV